MADTNAIWTTTNPQTTGLAASVGTMAYYVTGGAATQLYKYAGANTNWCIIPSTGAGEVVTADPRSGGLARQIGTRVLYVSGGVGIALYKYGTGNTNWATWSPVANAINLSANGLIHPSNCSMVSSTRATASQTAYATYMGRTQTPISTITMYYSVTTAATGAVTYAEWAVATGAPTQAADPSLTLPAQTVADVSAQYTSIGSYSATITPTAAIAGGTHWWLVFGSQQATQAPVIRAHSGANPHDIAESGTRANFRPSTNTGSANTWTRDTTQAKMWPVVLL